MMHRFDLDVDVYSEKELANLARKKKKKAKKKKKKIKAKKVAAGKKKKSGKKKAKGKAASEGKAEGKKGRNKGKKSKCKGRRNKKEVRAEAYEKAAKSGEKKAKRAAAGKRTKSGKKKANRDVVGERALLAKEAASTPKIVEVKLDLADIAAAFSPTRGERSFRQDHALQLGFVDLGEDHPLAQAGKAYPVVSAADERVGRVDFPKTSCRRMHLDLLQFYVEGFPGFLSIDNEGLVKIQASTKNPHDLSASMTAAVLVTDFRAKDGSYAAGFSSEGVFRNVLFQDWVALTVRLYEMGPGASKGHATIKGFLDGVLEIRSLDVLKGFPYLKLAGRLFDRVVNEFSRDPDDHLWGELPILEVSPRSGGAFLRTGIYLLGEKLNGKKKQVGLDQLEYRDGRIQRRNGNRLPNHLLFGVDLAEHEEG